jgi:predicted PhzF superfamily epimerase YddE/YHI9
MIEKITARVFCQQSGGGGNPVTMFAATSSLLRSTQVRLAQTCEWESVIVDTARQQLSFYMPNGDPVAFCAHAAMGGATVLSKQQDVPITFSVAREDDKQQTGTAIIHVDDIVSLEVQDHFSLQKVPHPPTLHRILRDAFGLQSLDLKEPWDTKQHPTFCNVTVFGRPKTLVYVNDIDKLQGIHVPPVGPSFVAACDALASTGIYLYCPVSQGFECRQFPRSSGYPEDPATGVAAAALACAHHQAGFQQQSLAYRFFHGTAMRRPSLLLVEDVVVLGEEEESIEVPPSRPVEFRLLGHVKVDDREIFEVVEDTE